MGTKYTGRLLNLGVGRETTRGAGVAPADWVPLTDFSFDDKVVKAISEAGVGQLIDTEDAIVTTKYAEGDLEANMTASTMGYFLYNLLGACSSSGDANGYTHSFTISNTNNHNSLALVVKDPNTTEMYRLAMIDNLEISAELDELVKVSVGFMSKTGVASSGTASYSATDYKFSKRDLSFKVASSIAGLSGATAISLKSLTLTVNKNVTMDDNLGTAEPEDFYNQSLSVEGELTLNYEDETWKNYMLQGTKRAIEIAFTNTDVVIGGGSTNPSLTLQMPNVHFYDWEPNYSNDEITTQTLSFKAMADLSGGSQAISTCDLVNAVDSY